MSKHVLFDLDGTLLDTARDFDLILNRQLIAHTAEPLGFDVIRETVSDGARALIKRGFNITETHEYFDTYLQELLDLYASQIPHTEAQLFEGMKELLDTISMHHFHWGVVTNKPSRFTLPLLKKFADLQTIDVVVCADQLQRSKPHPEGLLSACASLGCSPQDCIYVGDHLRDIEAGRNAGMQTIAVSWGYFPPQTRLEDWQADLIVQHPRDISRYLFGA